MAPKRGKKWTRTVTFSGKLRDILASSARGFDTPARES
jgi:hypothetical protein